GCFGDVVLNTVDRSNYVEEKVPLHARKKQDNRSKVESHSNIGSVLERIDEYDHHEGKQCCGGDRLGDVEDGNESLGKPLASPNEYSCGQGPAKCGRVGCDAARASEEDEANAW